MQLVDVVASFGSHLVNCRGDANRVTPEYEDDTVKRLKKVLCWDCLLVKQTVCTTSLFQWNAGLESEEASRGQTRIMDCDLSNHHLDQEANTFKAYATNKDYAKAMKTLEKYR